MLTSLYMLSLTILLTFLVLYAYDQIVTRIKKVKKQTLSSEQLQTEVEFSQSFK